MIVVDFGCELCCETNDFLLGTFGQRFKQSDNVSQIVHSCSHSDVRKEFDVGNIVAEIIRNSIRERQET